MNVRSRSKNNEYAHISIEQYNILYNAKTQYEEKFQEQEKEKVELKVEVNKLKRRKLVFRLEREWCMLKWTRTQLDLLSDDELMIAAFDEIKDQQKAKIDKIYSRNLWQRIINKKI